MYFVHSFHVQPARSDVVLSTTRYGQIDFCSSLRRGNVVAFQFHPERSGRLGLKIYQNLANLIAGTKSSPHTPCADLLPQQEQHQIQNQTKA